MIQQENLKKRLARLAAPIFIETLLIMMLGAVDTVMLSRHSDNSVAAVGVVNQIIMLTFLVFEVINLGTSVLCSQYLGARLHKQVVQVVGVSLLVNFAVGVGISMLLFGWAGMSLLPRRVTASPWRKPCPSMVISKPSHTSRAVGITTPETKRSSGRFTCSSLSSQPDSTTGRAMNSNPVNNVMSLFIGNW